MLQDNRPVITILSISYREGFKEECLQWMQETASIASVFEGFLGNRICISADTERELMNIFTFRNNDCLLLWEKSEERRRQTEKSSYFVESINQKSRLSGLEFMFQSPKLPKRGKMVLLTVCIIFILLNSLVPALQQLFTMFHLPVLLKSLLGVVVMVSLMTFLILPFLSKVLGRWLVS